MLRFILLIHYPFLSCSSWSLPQICPIISLHPLHSHLHPLFSYIIPARLLSIRSRSLTYCFPIFSMFSSLNLSLYLFSTLPPHIHIPHSTPSLPAFASSSSSFSSHSSLSFLPPSHSRLVSYHLSGEQAISRNRAILTPNIR